MPLTLEPTDYTPSTDDVLTQEQLDSVRVQVQAYLPVDYKTRLHPEVDTSYEPDFSAWVLEEGNRVAKGQPRPAGEGIDMSRYEADALAAPAEPTSDEDRAEALRRWRETLQRAYTSSTYLSGRLTNLSLLETYGKNAWLIGNSQLEDIVKALEKELEEKKRGLEQIEEVRRNQAVRAKSQLEALEAEWKKSVGGLVDVQLATEELRQKIAEKKRAGGVA